MAQLSSHEAARIANELATITAQLDVLDNLEERGGVSAPMSRALGKIRRPLWDRITDLLIGTIDHE